MKIPFARTLLAFTCLTFQSLFGLSAFAEKACPVIPLPNSAEKQDCKFVLSGNAVIVTDPQFDEQAYFLQKELLRYKGIAISINSKAASSNQIVLKFDKADSNVDSYSIKMNQNTVEIKANNKEGIFNGMMTFMQLVRLSDTKDSAMVECWNVKDTPRYAWRGFMLDESRHFFGKEKVEQILDWMATYKLNHFHWHLTDAAGWRLEIKQYPKLALIGGIGNYTDPFAPAKYYTQEDIKEIVRYASERFITIVPEIDMPGHASAANRAYPEFSGGGSAAYPDFTFNPGKDSVYKFLTNVLKEADALFPSQMIHIGGDEVHYGNEKWNTDKDVKNLMQKESLPDLKSVENYFFGRMAQSLFNMNNKVLAWDEVADSNLPTSNTIVFFWRDTKPEQLQKLLDKGFSIVLSPRHPFYLDYMQDTFQIYGPDWRHFSTNSIERIYNFSEKEFPVVFPKNPKILGVQANLWTERVLTEQRLDYMLFPRMAALAETAWIDSGTKNFDAFKQRLKSHLRLYKEDNIYYSDPFDRGLTGEPVN